MITESGELLSALGSLLAKGTGWLALCAAPRWLLRHRRPSWRISLTGLLLLTMVSLLPPFWTVILPASEDAAPVETSAAASAEAPAIPDLPPSPAGRLPSSSGVPPQANPWPWQLWLGLAWLGGATGIGMWMLGGFLTVRRWTRASVPLTDPAWQDILTIECRSLSLRRHPRLLVSPDAPGPCAAGILRPAILLPPACHAWDEETRQLVLRHELAHIARRDPRHSWVRSLLLAIHWPSPLVWLAVRRCREEEEQAADDAVIRNGASPDRYASALLFVARSCQFPHHTPLVSAMARTSSLESRIRRLLAGHLAPQSPARFAAAGVTLTILTAGILGCSAVRREHPSDDGHRYQSLAGKETPVESIDATALQKLLDATPSSAKEFTATFRVIDSKGTALTAPSWTNEPLNWRDQITVKPGQRYRMEAIREFPYPTKYDPPNVNPILTPPASFPVTPTTPRDFQFQNAGWTMDLAEVKVHGAFLILSGRFRETSFDGFIRGAGEASSPITAEARTTLGRETTVLLTDNKVLSPTFTTRETPFFVTALAGKPYRIRLNLRHPDAFLEVRVSP